MTTGPRTSATVAVVGAGTMGSGIAHVMAAAGHTVYLADVDEARVTRGIDGIRKSLAGAVAKGLVSAADAEATGLRLRGTTRLADLAGAGLIVEAVFEDLAVKQDLFNELDAICPPETILATNTSSFLVAEVAAKTTRPERVLGLHYFFPSSRNKLVEVISAKATAPAQFDRAWTLQEQIGKTPIRSADANGFIVNRFFVPWLNEATRLLEEGVADGATIDAAAKRAFSIGMGPFELMNVTGVPIALHAAATLGRAFGPMYAPTATLAAQVQTGKLWDLTGTPDESRFGTVADRLLGVVFLVASALVSAGVSTIEDTDRGALVGLRWKQGPFGMMEQIGVERAETLADTLARQWGVAYSPITRV